MMRVLGLWVVMMLLRILEDSCVLWRKLAGGINIDVEQT